jgi:hypothetical protein
VSARVAAEDVRPGDVFYFLGVPHMVSVIEPYAGPFDFVLGVARSADGWGISLEAGALLDADLNPATRKATA